MPSFSIENYKSKAEAPGKGVASQTDEFHHSLN